MSLIDLTKDEEASSEYEDLTKDDEADSEREDTDSTERQPKYVKLEECERYVGIKVRLQLKILTLILDRITLLRRCGGCLVVLAINIERYLPSDI